MGSSHMPPIPPANRTKKGPGSDPAASKDEPLKQPEHHHNAAEEGETANIKQNSTLLSLPPTGLIVRLEVSPRHADASAGRD